MHTHHHKSGLTLIEILVSIAVGSILLIAIFDLQRSLADNQRTINFNTQAYNEANIAIQAISRELRNARPAATGAYPIQLASDNEIIFYANIDTDTPSERIRYFLQDNKLNRGVINPTGNPPTYSTSNEKITLVIDYIVNTGNPIFQYYNGNWPSDTTNNPLPAPARLLDTKLVTISLTINPRPDRPESAYYLESSSQIRNLKNNL